VAQGEAGDVDERAFTLLHAFNNTDGAYPRGGVVLG
jgi:hypothetical protein